MIFSSYEERERVAKIVDKHEMFEELKPEHRVVIEFMYECLRDAESVLSDSEDDPRVINETLEALQEVVNLIKLSIMEAYVGITDADEYYWEGDEE